MKFHQFVEAVSNLVREWATEPNELGELLPRKQLQAIYDELREQTVHDLAETVRQRDEAMKQLHKHHLKGAIECQKKQNQSRKRGSRRSSKTSD